MATLCFSHSLDIRGENTSPTVFTHTEAQIAAAILALLEVIGAFELGLGGRGQVSGPANQLGDGDSQGIQHIAGDVAVCSTDATG